MATTGTSVESTVASTVAGTVVVQWPRPVPQWGYSGQYSVLQWYSGQYSVLQWYSGQTPTRTHTTGTPYPTHVPGHHHYPGYPTHPHAQSGMHHCLAHCPVDTNARPGMSKIGKLTPKGCLEKPLSVVSRASLRHAGLTVSVQPGMSARAREAFLVKRVISGLKTVISGQKSHFWTKNSHFWTKISKIQSFSGPKSHFWNKESFLVQKSHSWLQCLNGVIPGCSASMESILAVVESILAVVESILAAWCHSRVVS